jgi:hypothetical protein
MGFHSPDRGLRGPAGGPSPAPTHAFAGSPDCRSGSVPRRLGRRNSGPRQHRPQRRPARPRVRRQGDDGAFATPLDDIRRPRRLTRAKKRGGGCENPRRSHPPRCPRCDRGIDVAAPKRYLARLRHVSMASIVARERARCTSILRRDQFLAPSTFACCPRRSRLAYDRPSR